MSPNKNYVQDQVESIPYEKECPSVTSVPDGTEIYKYQENITYLTIELTALQFFVKEQFYVIKKQLKDMTNTQEPANQKSISCIQEEIGTFEKKTLQKPK